MTDTPPPDVAITSGVIALEIFTDPTEPPAVVEILAEVAFDGDAWVASDDDGRYVTAGYRSRGSALRALMLAHLDATTEPIRPRQPNPS